MQNFASVATLAVLATVTSYLVFPSTHTTISMAHFGHIIEKMKEKTL